MSVYSSFNTRTTPQAEQATASQVQNNAGGYTFEVDRLARAKRFLILGTEAGTYYQDARSITRDNASAIIALADTDGIALVDLIVDVAASGKAPKQQPALFALALAASAVNDATRAYALSKVEQVATTGTALFTFVGYLQQFRGWSRGTRRAVANWYLNKPVDRLGYQVAKYRSREGFSHRDLLRLSHPKTVEEDRRALFDWITHGTDGALPPAVEGYVKAQRASVDQIPGLIREFRLSWEMLPDEALNQVATWDALLDVGIPQTALMRQLPRLTNLGVIGPFQAGRTLEIAAQLADPERLKKARVHPVNVLVALRTYQSGRGRSNTWTPAGPIVGALDTAFTAAFGAVQPAGKRTLVGLDVSGSMGSPVLPNSPLTARDVGAAMAQVLISTEPDSEVYGFTAKSGRTSWGYGREAALTPLQFRGRALNDVINSVSNLPFGATDCSLPMQLATEQKWLVDTFITITDSETWHGPIHPHQALEQYRQQSGVDAKLIVLATTATDFTIADPRDPLRQLDIAGFGSDVPNLVTEFSRGF